MTIVRCAVAMAVTLDDVDLRILRALQLNARTNNSEIARQLGMVPSAILERIRKLEARGLLVGYEAKLDPKVAGYGLVAFINVKTEDRAADHDTAEKLMRIPEVMEVHCVAGEDCYLLKVRVQDVDALRRLLHDKVSSAKGVLHTRTTIVLETYKESGRLPLGQNEALARGHADAASVRAR